MGAYLSENWFYGESPEIRRLFVGSLSGLFVTPLEREAANK
jgi:hypothetical protein